MSITMRAAAFPFNFEGQKMLLTAPELNHLRPLTDAIEERLLGTRLFREMLPEGKGNGMNRNPHWQARFKNGAQIVSRLPQKDGKGIKGQHVALIELDEAQDYPLAGWLEIAPTLNNHVPGAMWRCHGVSKGVRDKFFEKTLPSSGWTVHRPMAMNRPNWDDRQRQDLIREYGGSRQNIDYRRNVYGEHGDASNSVFVLSRLMACVDQDDGSIYNSDVYQRIKIEAENLEGGVDISTFLDLPGTHLNGYSQKVGPKEVGSPAGYSAYYGGMDVGVTNHPSEILIYGQRMANDTLELLTRVQLHRVRQDEQIASVLHLFAFYGPRLTAFGIDKTGVGQPYWDVLTRVPEVKDRIHGFGFSEKRVVGFEDRERQGSETQADLAIYRNVIEATTDWLRADYVDTKRMRLPYDHEVLLEFQGQTYNVIRDNGNPYGTRRAFGGGSFHTLDAAKMVMAAKNIPPLEKMLEDKAPQQSVFDQFVF